MAKYELTRQSYGEGGLLALGLTVFGIGAPMLANEVSRNVGLALVTIGVIVIMTREAIKNT